MKYFCHTLLIFCILLTSYSCQNRNQMNVSDKKEAEIVSTNDTILVAQTEDTTIYYQPDIMASFKGGEEARVQFFQENMNIPKNLKKGNQDIAVFFQFVVEKDGSATNIRKLKGVNEVCDIEAYRLLKMIEWEPAKTNNKAVRSMFTFPVIFYKYQVHFNNRKKSINKK